MMKEDRTLWQPALLSLGLAAAEAPLFYTYSKEEISFLTILAIHGGISILPLLCTLFALKEKKEVRYWLLLFLSVFAAGPFGAVEFFLVSGLYLLFSYFSTPIHVWFEELFPLRKPTDFSMIFERVKAKWDDYAQPGEISSFIDLFNFGTEEQKLSVLEAIVKDFDPAYCPILLKGIQDPSNQIRIQSAAVIQSITLSFDKKLEALLAQKQDPPITLKLAEHYDALALLGILDPKSERETQEFALYYYKEYLNSDPENLVVWFAVGRLLYHIGDMEEFIRWSEKYRARFGNFPGMFQSWHLEALYRLNRSSDFARLLKEGR